MDMHAFPTGTMARVHTVLEHVKAIRHDVLPKTGIDTPVFTRACREVEEDKEPHDPIGVEAIVRVPSLMAFHRAYLNRG